MLGSCPVIRTPQRLPLPAEKDMRPVSILIAVVVAAILYLLVIERDRLMEFAGAGGDDPATAEAVEEVTEASEAPENDATDTAERVVSVAAFTSEAQQIESAVLLRGRTEAARKVEVRSETSGLVNSEPLRKGATVEAGQLLCEIAPGTRLASLAEVEARLPEAQARLPEAEARLPEARGRLAEAEARLAEARINDNAARQLSADGFASETRVAATAAAVQSALASVETAKAGVISAEAGVKAARAGIEAAEAAVDAAKKEIDRLTITAPFGGILETDTAELGTLLQPGALCATIIQLNPMKLVGFVPETEVAKVQVGALAGARTTAGQEVTGKVTFLSRSSDEQTRTFRVEITASNDDLTLRDGQTAEILINSDGTMAHLLPASALTLNDGGALGVRIAKDGRAQFVPVSILRDTVEGVWVSGLEQKADVIITGQEYVTDDVKVDVSYTEAGL